MRSTARLELPDDATIERLTDDLRQRIGRHWMHRAEAELGVAGAFADLLPRLRDVGAVDAVLALAAKAIDDEQRHGELCLRLAARYFGTSEPALERKAIVPVDFGTGDEPTEVALTILGTCCVNESIASEWIRSCWEAASSPTAISANRHHLRDEIDHARLGWAHLASDALSPAVRAHLRTRVSRVLEVNVAEWKRPDPHLPPEGVPAHGHLSVADNDDVVEAAVRDVVLPGLRHVGLA